MQCDRFFRRLSLPRVDVTTTCSFFRSNLFEFIIACIHQLHVQLRRQQIVTQRFGDAAGVASFPGGGISVIAGTSAAGAGVATTCRTTIQHAPEEARYPGELAREVRCRPKARQLPAERGKLKVGPVSSCVVCSSKQSCYSHPVSATKTEEKSEG